MATAQLEKVKEFLTCTVCADTYSDPCTLMCQHSFCRICITKYTKTKPEALRSKTIPCPSCRQVMNVPDPTKPVEQWAAQIKPSIIILGLIDTSQPDPAIKGTGRNCSVCEHLGETIPATSWCPECEMALCDRCSKAHFVTHRDHEICDLSADSKTRRRRKVMCREHKKNNIEFYCRDCKKSACQTCCIIHHRSCKSVVTIESIRPEMMSDLQKKKEIIIKRLETNSAKLSKNKAAMDEASQKKLNIKSQILSASKRVIDKIRQKEKELMDQLDQVTETQISQLQADVKTEEIEVQMYRQHCEFIEQALNSESVMDVYDVYQACESGVLDLGDDREVTETQSITDIRFTQGSDNICDKLDDLQLGKIDVTYEYSTRSSQLQCNTIDVKTWEDEKNPDLYDVIVINDKREQIIVVTDGNNKCVKSFYTRNSQTCYSRLPMNGIPWGISQLNTNQVVVTVPNAQQIIKIKVTPDLTQLSTIKTSRNYRGIAVLNTQSMAVGCGNSIDILNMSGQMATAQLEKVKEFLTCTVCYDTYSDPCTLMCQHSFCRNCITKYIKTKPEALRTKTIPCPSCRQGTKVPDPTKPVEQWATQIKPSIIILGLIDTSQPDPTIKGTGRNCSVCEHLGETIPATSWCPECEMALCDRCSKAHFVTHRDHEICDLSAEVKIRRRRKVMCREHKKNNIEFYCRDCKKSACQTCCILHHRSCKSVVTIESVRPEMMSDLHRKKETITKLLERNSTKVRKSKAAINEASQKKLNIKFQIQSASKTAIDKIKQKEKELMDQLDQVTETRMSQLQADVKSGEIEMQMYRQHCEFIDQALNSESVMDVYDVYQACESGVLDLGDDREITGTQSITDIRFIQGPGNICDKLDDLQLGKIDVTYEYPTRSSQLQSNTINARTREDVKDPFLRNVIIMDVEREQTIIVTDGNNDCVKSFYTRNSQSCHSRLPMNASPYGISQLNTNQVVVTVPDAKQIVKIRVTPDLRHLSTIKTGKDYSGVAVLNAKSMAASWSVLYRDTSVDILNMSGQVMKSVSAHNNVKLFMLPSFMCVNNKGNILVSDGGKHPVTCLTPDGDVLWQYAPIGDRQLQFPRGITTDNEGHILLADRSANTVIQLSESGAFIKEVLTVKDGVSKPYGLTCHKPGKLLVCTESYLKEFTLR